MNKILLIIVLFSISVFASAQKNKDAEIVLEKAADKALKYKTIHSKFEFLVENAQQEIEDTYKGELWVKGKRFKMSVDKTVIFSDGKTRWVYLTEVNEVNISTIEKDEGMDPEDLFLIEPLSLFTLYKKGFKYSISGTQLINEINYTVVDLSPEELDKPYFKIKYWISDEYDYYAVKYFQKDGTRITFNLVDFKSNEKIKDSAFSFDAKSYPNVEIIDLRD